MSKKNSKTTKRTRKPTQVVDDIKRGRGRPTDYKPEYAERAFQYALLGATDEQMAEFFGVTFQTINNWKTRHIDFFEALSGGKEKADAQVLHSLYKKAIGYSYETERIIGKGDNKKVVKVSVYVPPDVSAQQFWMRNRQRKDWSDTKQVEVGGPGSFDHMDADDLKRYILQESAALGLYDAETGSDSIN